MRRPRVEAVVFDLLYTLVHPGTYPGGTGRVGWLADILGVEQAELRAHWAAFEPALEAGRGRELDWVSAVAAELGVSPSAETLARIDADWDLTRRAALLNPPPDTMRTLTVLRRRGIKLGVLSNTHALELRTWHESPLASLFDATAFSYEIGVCKPDPAAYGHVLGRLGVPAALAAYVGDGSNDELAGARAAGFSVVILAEEAPALFIPGKLSGLRAQADATVASLPQVIDRVSG